MKGYSRMPPVLVPMATIFWMGSKAKAVGGRGKPCLTVGEGEHTQSVPRLAVSCRLKDKSRSYVERLRYFRYETW